MCFDFFEAVAQSCSVKAEFLKFLQNSQENTCVGASLFLKKMARQRIPFYGATPMATSGFYMFCKFVYQFFLIRDHSLITYVKR